MEQRCTSGSSAHPCSTSSELAIGSKAELIPHSYQGPVCIGRGVGGGGGLQVLNFLLWMWLTYGCLRAVRVIPCPYNLSAQIKIRS